MIEDLTKSVWMLRDLNICLDQTSLGCSCWHTTYTKEIYYDIAMCIKTDWLISPLVFYPICDFRLREASI